MKEWGYFNIFVDNYKKELDAYLSEKLSFHRRKQHFLL